MSVCPLCRSGASIIYKWNEARYEARCFIEILGGGIKSRDQPIKYTIFGQFIMRKITKIRFPRLSVCLLGGVPQLELNTMLPQI